MNIDENRLKDLINTVNSLSRNVESKKVETRNMETAKENAVNSVGEFFKGVPSLVLEDGFTFFLDNELYKIRQVKNNLNSYSLFKYSQNGFYLV